ncbi:MAG: hypothetical protein BWK73_18450 [Thiothrix lacustris]|uniref:DUF3305 domain-containing protein n=1 Tax=Thiothrix lacustris TaxID=525917 RepID=A0A1Y1QQ26_9GAMM|nr:MAG: hypothetical protein BWK73_18450 [Thiothrix lacustris]
MSTHHPETLPQALPIAAILEKRPSISRWADAYWTATGVIVGERSEPNATLLHTSNGIAQYLYPGLTARLHLDECESYYHNLKAPYPSGYIVASLAADGTPTPYHFTLSFDEANSYLQGSAQVYPVPLPPELYCWVEAYVLEHYAPELRKKRRLTDINDKGH